MTDIAIRVDNLSKLYHLGVIHQRPDTTSAVLSASLRDALTGILPRISRIKRIEAVHSPKFMSKSRIRQFCHRMEHLSSSSQPKSHAI